MRKLSELIGDKLSYRDSRAAAYGIFRPRPARMLARFVWLLLITVLAALAWNALTGTLPPQQRAVLFLFLLSVGLWMTEAVPAFAVGLLIMGYLVFVLGTTLILPEPMDVRPYLDTWSSQVVWLLLGGFFMAEGLAKTGLDRGIFAWAMHPHKTSPARMLLAVMIISAIASMFISNTSTTVLMIGAMMPLVRRLGSHEPFTKALLIAIPLSSSVGGMGTIIGSAPNAIAAGVADDFGSNIDFVDWMVIGVPVALALVTIAWAVFIRMFALGSTKIELDIDEKSTPALPGRRERRIVIAVSLLTVTLWMTTPLHGLHVAAVSLIPIVGLTMTQVVQAPDVRGLPWDTLMLVAGGLSLGAAVVNTGLAERMALELTFLTGLDSDVVVFGVLALLTVMLSNFMSNTATVSLILPVAIVLVPGRELEMCLILGLSSACALLLPVSTPPNAIAFSTGEIQTRDFRIGGILIGLLGPMLAIAWVLFAVPLVF